jgi:hypothetical protein
MVYFSDEGWKDQSAHFKGLDLQVRNKRQKQSTA